MAPSPRLRDIGPEMFRSHRAGEYEHALAVVERALPRLRAEEIPTATFWQICLLNRSGRPADATARLRDALDAGWWYGRELLREDDDLASLAGDPSWEELVARSLDRQATAAAAPPHGVWQAATAARTAGSVVALHARGGSVGHTVAMWEPVLGVGLDLHVPGSSQLISHDRATWDDASLAHREIVEQVETDVRTDRVIVAGRSQGAIRAGELAGERSLPVVGAILVSHAPEVERAARVVVPVWLIVGEHEDRAIRDRIERFADHQTRRGAACELRVVDGMGHEYPEPFGPHAMDAIAWIAGQQAASG